MRNIFKIFKENKELKEENKILTSKTEALTEFRKNFDKFYNSMSSYKIVERRYDNAIVLGGAFHFDNMGDIHYPTDECKRIVVQEIARQLEPYIEFDLVDNDCYGTKILRGKLTVYKGEQ